MLSFLSEARKDSAVKRREFIKVLGGAAAAWPLATRAQQSGKTFHIGMVETISAELNAVNLAAFLRGLQGHGYVEGRNLVISTDRPTAMPVGFQRSSPN